MRQYEQGSIIGENSLQMGRYSEMSVSLWILRSIKYYRNLLEEVHNPTIYVTTSFTDIHSSLTLKTYQKYVPLLHEKLVVQNIVESCCE